MKRSSSGGRRWACGALIASLAMVRLAAQTSGLDPVLERAGAYVLEFQRQLSGVVAEEQYVQDVRYALGSGNPRFNPFRITHRELKSDLLMVKPIGGDRWLQFRDVFDVDGKPVRDRNERLMQLFLTPSSSSAAQSDRIMQESSRYNIGSLQRNVNVPVLALVILDPANQGRFRFKPTDRREPLLEHGPAPSGSVVVEFQETEKQTIIRTTNDRDMASRGRFWIDPANGHVLASELIAEDPTIKGTIDVEYGLEPTIGLLVPVAMHERYEIRRDQSRVDGEARYSRFRQFQVKVDEKLAPVVKP